MSATIYHFPAAPDPAELVRHPMNDLGNGMRLIQMIGGVIDDDGEVDCSQCNLLFELGRGWIGFNVGPQIRRGAGPQDGAPRREQDGGPL